MGELLRAVLDQSCRFKAPAFYTVAIEKSVPPPSGAFDFASGVLQCKADTWFLITGYTLTTVNLNTNQYNIPTEFSGVMIVDPKNGLRYDANINSQGAGQPRALANRNLNNFETLPEYILFGPSSLIQIEGFMLTNNGGTQYADWITLAGIEYRE